jgi:hypothetical protein
LPRARFLFCSSMSIITSSVVSLIAMVRERYAGFDGVLCRAL